MATPVCIGDGDRKGDDGQAPEGAALSRRVAEAV